QSGVVRCTLSGLPCTPNVLGPTGSGIVVDGSNVYWTAAAGPVRCALGGCGGAPTAIATAQNSSWAITVDGTNVYWTDLGFTVDRCVLAGGCGSNPTKVANATRANDVAVDGTTVYWVDVTLNTVSSCAIAGCGGTPTVLASGQSSPTALVVDATAIYWVNANPGAVMKLAK
ncbi:MAG TPA: hypothetical protein VIJ22_08610, partial [Polyangiaceae bacterium]